MAASLARSQFFFSENVALSAVAKSCGSKVLVSSKAKSLKPSIPFLSRPARIPSSSIPLSSSASRNGALNNLSSFKRSFSTLPTTTGSFSVSTFFKRQFSTIPPRYSSSSSSATTTSAFTNNQDMSKIAEQMSKSFAPDPLAKTRKRRPVNTWKPVGYWLIISAGLVFGIVVLGGLTRLTESGLSITEWKPVTGSVPPLSEAEWEEEFAKYKSSPEFKLLNSNITLSEFKFIFFMEWSHRLLGRAIGLFVVLPAVYFVATKKVTPHVAGRLGLIAGLLGLQGFIGWWMVKSGLDDKFLEDGSHPRVSQYRLATHLCAAFLLYTAMVFAGLDIIREANWIKSPTAAASEIMKLDNPVIRRYRKLSTGLLCFVFFTAMSGAFVAGLDAGMIYNSFPYMGETIVPPSNELFDPNYNKSNPDSSWSLFWRNMLENPTTVQFNHRVLAVSTFFLITAFHLYTHRMKSFLPRSAYRANMAVMGIVSVQVALGISTLVYVVPTPLAAAHQAGALALLTSVIFMCARLRQPRTAQRLLISALEKKASKTAAEKASRVYIKTAPQKPF